MSWQTGRPLFHRLPIESGQYQDNPVCDWLTQPWDRILMEVHAAIAQVEADFINPETARSDALDWLAQHHGFTGEYWETSWSEAIKRQLITDAQIFIWGNKGRPQLMEYFFGVFAINARIYLVGSFLAGVNKAGDPVGGEGLHYFILMPLTPAGYLRTTYEWKLTEKLNRLYMPVYVRSQVCYERFYAGFSQAGEPVF